MSEENKISRRDFIKGAAAGAAAVATAGVLGTSAAQAQAQCPPTGVPAKWDLETEVLVVGTGFAGQASAITAADAGAQVLMIEKAPQKDQGGNSRVCGQGFIAPSKAIWEDYFKYYKAMTEGQGYPVPDEWLRLYIEESSNNRAWLEGLGATVVPDVVTTPTRTPGSWIPFYPEFPGANALASEPGYYSVSGGKYTGAGRDWYFLEDQVLARKNIKKMFETPAKSLIQDPATKEILGVVAESGGKLINIKAKRAVVMCSGGYEYNQQMIRDFIHVPEFLSPGTPYNTGDGIKMCMAVGADLINMGVYAAPWGYRCLYPEYKSAMSWVAPTKGGYIIVAADHKRYKDEFWTMPAGPWPNHRPTYCGNKKENGVYQREKLPFPLHAILDEDARKAGASWWSSSWNAQIDGVTTSADNAAEIARGWAVKADSIKDLATKIGRDPAVLQATIDKWNADVAAGKDTEFGRKTNLTAIKTAPFYAVKLSAGCLNTQGGMARNIKQQVIDKNGNPIPRLYAAGEIGDRVWSHLYQCMSNVGAGCMACGRIAGKNAAAEKPMV